jgi:(2Fe-2S) ferredoxin
MNFYKYHAFFCTNKREDNKKCCGNSNAKELYRYMKDQCREKGILKKGAIGVSESRCLGRCVEGPVMVIYPQEIWYRCETKQDIDEIIDSYFTNNQVVKRLTID